MRILPLKSGRFRKILLGVVIAALGMLGIWSCQLSQDPKAEDVASFDELYDSLAQYDSVVIVFKDGNGNFLDTVFKGKVDSHDQLRNLPVPGWDGKKAQITISGFNGGILVSQIEKKYNGTSDGTDTTIVVVAPGTNLACEVRELTMTENDSLGIPVVTVTPVNLNDKTLLWSSSDSTVVTVGPTSLKSHARGTASLSARLRSNPSKSLTIPVTVIADNRIPDSVNLQPDTLRVAVGDSAGQLTVRVSPSSADAGVTWKVADPTVATVSAEGAVQGLKAGQTRVWVVSKRKISLSDSSLVLVSVPVPVQKIRFLKNPSTLFVGGASDTLAVAVTPSDANPGVLFTLGDSSIVSLKDNKITGLRAGRTFIIARSKPSPGIADTLQINVFAGHPVEKVVIGDKSLGPVYVGGSPVRFSASVLPGDAPQQIQWTIANGSIAAIDDSGRVTGRTSGAAVIYAVSSVDSSKKDSAVIQVKRDMPQLNPGRDTIVSLGTTVAFTPTVKKQNGSIVQFKWDLDGDLTWDDSAAAVKTVSRKYDQEKEYTVRFYVRDDQGNDTIAALKLKVVAGLVVLIQQPLNDSYSNKSPVKVLWSVNGQAQDSLPLETLKEGVNILTRTAKDSAGTPFSASVTVNYDITAPNKPLVHGAALVATAQPTWTWSTGGSGGAGAFRYNLDAETFAKPETQDTSYTPPAALAAGAHILYVQERDAAGNWSLSGQFSTTLDLTPPLAPSVSAPPSPTNNRRPTWTWTTRGGGNGNWRYKLGDRNLNTGATETQIASYTPMTDLAAGTYTLHVQERDTAGNWSPSDSASVTVDLSAPGSPQVSVSPTSPTKDQKPTWSWKSGSAATGNFRYKLNDPDLTAGATMTSAFTYTPATDLVAGIWILYVQEKNAAGTWSPSGSATVLIDTTRPKPPTVSVAPASPASDRRPIWSWNKQEAGVGFFRYHLDSGSPKDTGSTSFQPSTAGQLAEGTYTLYVQEGDSAGNWSDEASAQIRIDLTPPTQPTVSGTATPTSTTTPTWTWVAGIGGNGDFRYRLNDTDMTGATATTQLSYTPPAQAAGSYTLYVQERDSAGNWSPRGSYSLTIDLTPPGAPTLNASAPPSPLNTLKPTWSWTSGGGGNGNYQVKLGDNDFGTGAINVNATSYTPSVNLTEGAQTLFVRERNAAGNWSSPSSGRTLFLAPRDTLEKLGFSAGQVSQTIIQVTSTGVVYAAYLDNGVQVKRYNASTNKWVDAGSNSVGLDWIDEFAISPTDIPYVVSDSHVRRLVGGNWEDVGDPNDNLVHISGSRHSLAFTSTGTPYLAFLGAANDYMITLSRFTGVVWVQANSNVIDNGQGFLDLAMDANNRPVLLYEDLNGYGVFAVTTDPNSSTSKWDTLGSGNLNTQPNAIKSLRVKTSSNRIYVGLTTFQDNILRLYSSSGADFSEIGSIAGSDEFDISIGKSGVPYIAYVSGPSYDRIAVMGRFNGSWVNVGADLQSASTISWPSLAISPDGVPYVGYSDQSAGERPSVIRTSFDP